MGFKVMIYIIKFNFLLLYCLNYEKTELIIQLDSQPLRFLNQYNSFIN
jgi:hypothetical protein